MEKALILLVFLSCGIKRFGIQYYFNVSLVYRLLREASLSRVLIAKIKFAYLSISIYLSTYLYLYLSIYLYLSLSIYPSGILTTVAVFRKPNAIPLCFSTDLVLNFLLSWLLVLLPSTLFLRRPLFLLSRGIQFIINFGILSSGILLKWPYSCSLVCSIITTNTLRK